MIGDLPWQSLMAGTLLPNSLPAVLSASTDAGVPVELPCLVSIGSRGSRFWRLTVQAEPSFYQPWPKTRGASPDDIIRAVAKAARSTWIDTLTWPLPFWLEDASIPEDAEVEKFETWVLELEGQYGETEREFSQSARRNIRISGKRGVSIIERPSEAQLREFSRLWRSSFHSQGWSGTFYTEPFFMMVPRFLRDKAHILLARQEGRIAAGCIVIEEPEGAVYYLGALDREYKDCRPSYAVFAHAVKMLCDSGKRYLNFGGAGGIGSVASFKELWGARPKEVRCLVFKKRQKKLPVPLKAANFVLRNIGRRYFRSANLRFRALAACEAVDPAAGFMDVQ